MKAVQLLVNSILPEDLRNYGNKYDVKDMNKILYAVAQKHPDKFAEVEKQLSDFGRKASYLQGATITLKDLEPVVDKKKFFSDMDSEIKALPKDKNYKQRKSEIQTKYNEMLSRAVNEVSLKNRNNIAMAVLSGARGKVPQLKAMIGSPWQFSDYKGEPVDFIAKNSFAEGIDPATFLASTYGARSSVISTKCVDSETLTRMADLSVKKIKDIKVGEYVLGADKEGHVFPVKVLNVFDQGEKYCYMFRFLSHADKKRAYWDDVVCTNDHKFLTRGGKIVPVRELAEATRVRGVRYETPTVTQVELRETAFVGVRHCYDIEVDHPDHLFVLANGLITSNSSTAKGGDIAKQFAAANADMTIREENCHTHNGIALSIDDKSLVGRALAQDVAGHKAGEFITSDTLTDLRKKGLKSVVARSALTCRAHGGLCAHCVGKFYNGGKLPRVGDAVGLMASTSVSEPITQMALCLASYVPARLADGSVKAIKDIVPGDIVIGADLNGKTKPAEVVALHYQGFKPCVEYTFSRANEHLIVTCTEDHKFLTPDGTLLRVGDADAIVTEAGAAEKIGEEFLGDIPCYDITVDHPDHLFVLANGLITSNSAKHTAGMTSARKTYAGIPVITQFTQSPEKYKDKAVVSEVDGKVESIEEAEQGGTYITVGGKRHYVQTGHEPEVKVGDTVEAGDFLSEGLPDVEDVVRLKGLGAGRKLYADRLNQILADSGAASDPRNTEVLARGALRHVRVTNPDGFGDYMYDDLVDYDAAEASYRMPEGTKAANPGDVVGQYLQQPSMHYTIGTRITPAVVKDLKENGYNRVFAAKVAPGFEPEMVRLRTASHTTRDWLASLGTSYLTQQLQESAVRGDDTNVQHNPDYRPRIAYGAGFAKNVRETGEF